ncbi:MAG: alpha/beta fold hydrolase [Solirubrobacterales bacterium]|nr:alpha/beta fold hydrolase [Solirubrobacterales bacterium]
MIWLVSDEVAQLIDVHSAAGRRFEAGGLHSFVREQGSGPDVVLLHGVPTSSFLYRKVLPPLADQGMRALALDLPGLGLADRPEDFDYSWSGLARWLGEAVDALGLERLHLVVHDIAGPIGCQWAIADPGRVLSLTVLNTMLDPAAFRRPWMMRPFATRGAGEAWLRATPRPAFAALFRSVGLADRAATSTAEIYAHHALLRRLDGGRAFLQIMRGFELDAETQSRLARGLAERPYSARIVWGEHDPVFGLDEMRVAQRVLGLDDAVRLPAKHFLQEDQAPALAYAIADHVAPLG